MKAFKVVADIAILAGKAAAKAGLIIPQIVGKRSADPELDSLDLSSGPELDSSLDLSLGPELDSLDLSSGPEVDSLDAVLRGDEADCGKLLVCALAAAEGRGRGGLGRAEAAILGLFRREAGHGDYTSPRYRVSSVQ